MATKKLARQISITYDRELKENEFAYANCKIIRFEIDGKTQKRYSIVKDYLTVVNSNKERTKIKIERMFKNINKIEVEILKTYKKIA